MKFLSARWLNLLLANYTVDPEVLIPFVPRGTELDLFEGKAYVSLVAFLFDRTRVMGIPIPFHRQFEEVNLRFYVSPQKDRTLRAVTFIKEIVPRHMITLIANVFFNENYATMPMDHGVEENTYWYRWGRNPENRFAATVDSEPGLPEPGSIGEFITEHYWGYAQGRKTTTEYHVEHPQWECCTVENYDIQVDFEANYGSHFSFLNSRQPHNVLYAKGSPVTVSFPRRL